MKLKACFMSFLMALGDGRHLLSRQNAPLFCRCGLSVTTLVSGSISLYPLDELEVGNSQYGGRCLFAFRKTNIDLLMRTQ